MISVPDTETSSEMTHLLADKSRGGGQKCRHLLAAILTDSCEINRQVSEHYADIFRG
jgi:hypothetical protein